MAYEWSSLKNRYLAYVVAAGKFVKRHALETSWPCFGVLRFQPARGPCRSLLQYREHEAPGTGAGVGPRFW